MAAAGPSAAAAKKAPKPSLLRALLPPLIGFGVGWGGYSMVESSGLIDERRMIQTHCWNLKAQRWVRQSAPAIIADNLCMPTEQLESMIAVLETTLNMPADGQGLQERVPFTKILQECRVQEQMEWLSDHLLEDIPFFYIADIFHSWAEIHEPAVATASRKDAVFDSRLVCEGVWKKMLDDVIPFDVSVRVLATLAILGKDNAKWIAALQGDDKTAVGVGGNAARDAIGTILGLQSAYHAKLADKKKEAGDVVSSASVDAATAALILELNRTAVSGRRFPWVGTSPSGPYPILKLHRAQWCSSLRDHPITVALSQPIQQGLNDAQTQLCPSK